MKISDIKVGGRYTNGDGVTVRRVTGKSTPRWGSCDVTYELESGSPGTTMTCKIETFARWAEREADPGRPEPTTSFVRVDVHSGSDSETYTAEVPRGLPHRVLALVAAGMLYEHDWVDVVHEVFVDGELIAGAMDVSLLVAKSNTNHDEVPRVMMGIEGQR